ncbi:TolC family protein [Thalassospira lucentensis]|uniref:TolC family protein n=1 Tax=Thalassospira lucentensis TaxID=168935 RepID=UPI002941BEA5|nr:TolC family protein [Thalassospira lucentensis]WOI10017.1 TolC family protein [Thalassospira lucentensis]
MMQWVLIFLTILLFLPETVMSETQGSVFNEPQSEETSLTLADAVFLGVRDNRTIKSAYIDRVIQKFDLRVAEDQFTPQMNVSGEVARSRIGNAENTAFDVSPGVTLETRTGAVFNFIWNNQAELDEGSRTLTSALEVGAEQPLLRGAGSDVVTAPLRQARLGEKVNQLRLKATIAETVGNIIFAHRDLLLAQEELALVQNAVSRAEDLLNINRTLIASGRMAAMDAVQTEADLEAQKLRLLQVRQRREMARIALLDLLNLELGSNIAAIEAPTPQKVDSSDIDNLLRIALDKRQDYLGQLLVVQQSRLGVVIAENEQLWDISLFGRGRLGREWVDDRSNDNISDVTAGLRFSIPVNDLSRRQRLVQADTSQKSAELQLMNIRAGIEAQVRTSSSEVDLLWRQLTVAKRSHELASQAIEIEKMKLNAGRSTTFQVRLLEDSLRQSENQLLAARIGYLNALTRLDLQLGTTLDTWQIVLSD